MDTCMIAMEIRDTDRASSMLAIVTLVHITWMKSSKWLLTLRSISKTEFRKPSQSRGPCKISPLLPVILISLYQLHQVSGGGTAGNCTEIFLPLVCPCPSNLSFCPQESRAQYSWGQKWKKIKALHVYTSSESILQKADLVVENSSWPRVDSGQIVILSPSSDDSWVKHTCLF